MEDAILNFNKQFGFEPEIINSEKIKDNKRCILAGMGGSHLASGLLKMYKPGIDLYVHRDYGLPPYDDEFFAESLLIASSYSGNTEETLDFLEEGYAKGYNMAVISTGGKMLDFAKENQLPYIQIPDDHIQPRSALGYSIVAMAKFVCGDQCVKDLRSLEKTLDPKSLQKSGAELAESLKGKIPIIYASHNNLWVAYNWKIKFNETGKTPAFYNIFPECNHNELAGFNLSKESRDLSSDFHIIILRDIETDHPRIQKRMAVVEGLLEEKGISVSTLVLNGNTKFEKIFNSTLLADWTAFSMAQNTGSDPENIPIIEGLKEKMSGKYKDNISDTLIWD